MVTSAKRIPCVTDKLLCCRSPILAVVSHPVNREIISLAPNWSVWLPIVWIWQPDAFGSLLERSLICTPSDFDSVEDFSMLVHKYKRIYGPGSLSIYPVCGTIRERLADLPMERWTVSNRRHQLNYSGTNRDLNVKNSELHNSFPRLGWPRLFLIGSFQMTCVTVGSAVALSIHTTKLTIHLSVYNDREPDDGWNVKSFLSSVN